MSIPEQPLVCERQIEMDEIVQQAWIAAADVFGGYEVASLSDAEADAGDGFAGTWQPEEMNDDAKAGLFRFLQGVRVPTTRESRFQGEGSACRDEPSGFP